MKSKDIKELKKKYPKSIAKLKEWDGIRSDGDIGLWKFTQFFQGKRFFYDFFDEQEIYILVRSEVISLENHLLKWMWEIHKDLKIEAIEYDICIFNARTQAEEVAFLKAFEILENKLTEIKESK